MSAVAGTSGRSSRFTDSPLAFGLRRFTDGDKNVLWRFEVRRFCSGDVLHAEDATIAGLTAMRTWLDEAIKTVGTDGGRTTP